MQSKILFSALNELTYHSITSIALASLGLAWPGFVVVIFIFSNNGKNYKRQQSNNGALHMEISNGIVRVRSDFGIVELTMFECVWYSFFGEKHFEPFYPFLKLSNTIKVAKFFSTLGWIGREEKCITVHSIVSLYHFIITFISL